MKLIQLDDFQMYVGEHDPGISHSLIKRASRLAQGIDPGPERESAFTWIWRDELTRLFDTEEIVTVYDVGANIGLFSLIANHIAKQNRTSIDYSIEAIEPDPNNVEILKRNFIHNNVEGKVHPVAIGNYNGEGEFYLSNFSNLGSLLRHKRETGTYKVKVSTLPGLRKIDFWIGCPNIIKADLEGGEVGMLQGARNILIGKNYPSSKILMEVHPIFYTKEESLENELRFLFDNGWSCKYMVSAAVIQPDKFKEAGLEPWKEFPTTGHSRAIYRFEDAKNKWLSELPVGLPEKSKIEETKDLWHEYVLNFACHPHLQEIPGKKSSPKIVRSILIEKEV